MRPSLENHQDRIAKGYRVFPGASSFFSNFKDIKRNAYLKNLIKLEALRDYHTQEVEALLIIISNLKTQIPEWIPIKKKPPINTIFLVNLNGNQYRLAYRIKSGIYMLEGKMNPKDITHWQALTNEPPLDNL